MLYAFNHTLIINCTMFPIITACLHIHNSYTHYDTEAMWLAKATYIATVNSVIEMKKTSATSQWLCTGCHFVSNISYLL